MKTFRTLLAAIHWMPSLMMAASTLAIAQQHAHVHGVLSLNVAVDAQALTLQMEVPLDNFLGFERGPRTDAERKLDADMVARLKAADKLFVLDPKAGCSLSKVKLESAVLELGDKAKPATPPAKTAPAKGGKEPEGHADIDVDISFTCTNASQARFIDVKLFDAFKGVRTINAQVASGQGQFKRTLSKAAPKLAWGK